MRLFSRTLTVLFAGGLLVVGACEEPTSYDESVFESPAFARPAGVGKPPDDIPMLLTILAGTGNMLVDDGKGVYEHEVCGVLASLGGPLEGPNFVFRPFDSHLKPKILRDLEDDPSCGFPRMAYFALELAMVHRDQPDPMKEPHSRDISLEDAVVLLGVRPFDPIDQLHRLHSTSLRGLNLIIIPDGEESETSTQGEAFNLRYCLGLDGRGRPFRFNKDTQPGSNDLEVTRVGTDDFHMRTQPFPKNVGSCEHTRLDGSVIELFLHMDLAYDITPLP